MIQLGAIVFN